MLLIATKVWLLDPEEHGKDGSALVVITTSGHKPGALRCLHYQAMHDCSISVHHVHSITWEQHQTAAHKQVGHIRCNLTVALSVVGKTNHGPK